MDDTDAALITLRSDVERRRTAEQRAGRVRWALATERKRQLELQEQLRLEQEDVERLEGMSFAAFVATLRGIRDERLRAEREEYVAARLRHDGSVSAIAALEGQLAEVNAEIAGLAKADARYEAALSAREQRLLADDTAGQHGLRAVVEELGALRATLRELDEAAAACDAAERALRPVAQLLGKAEDWGAWDLFGGGMIATAVKHERIQQAGQAAARARQALQRLGTELSDVGLAGAGLEVELGTFASAADFWLDGWFADVHVQSRIEAAQKRVAQTRAGVARLRAHLRAETGRARARARALEQERRQHLERT